MALPPLIWRLRWAQGVRCVYSPRLRGSMVVWFMFCCLFVRIGAASWCVFCLMGAAMAPPPLV